MAMTSPNRRVSLAQTTFVRGASFGFTLVEILVVLAIIGILTSISIPAVMRAQEAARKTQCLNRMSQVGLAIQNFETSRNRMPGHLESLGQFPGGPDPADPSSFGGDVPPHVKLASWQAVILGQLDNQPLYERWSMDRYPLMANDSASFGMVEGGYAKFCAGVEVNFMCPSASTSDGPGSNQFIANTGLNPPIPELTYTRTGQSPVALTFERSQSNANGVFHNRYRGFLNSGSPTTVAVAKDFDSGDFRDGRSQTIIVSENVNALPWYRVSLGDSSLLADTQVIDREITCRYPLESRYVSGMTWEFADALNFAGAPPVPRTALINSGDAHNLEMSPSTFSQLARPSSDHAAGVNILFADGSVTFVTESLDYRIFQSWMTPQTSRSDMPMNEYLVTEAF